MKISSEDASYLRREILLGFHTQFAENQRAREGGFFKILAFLAVMLGGYGAVLGGVLGSGSEPIHPREAQVFQLLSALLLFSATWVVVTLSNNFRRDQYVNVRIRQACGLLGTDGIFPTSYDPKAALSGWGFWAWMPDLYLIFYCLFMILQLAVVGVFAVVIAPRFDPSVLRLGSTVAEGASLGLFVISLFPLPWLYRRKLISVMQIDAWEYGVAKAYVRRLKSVFRRA